MLLALAVSSYHSHNLLDDTSCLRSLRPSPDRPRAYLIWSTREVPDEVERRVARSGDLRQRAVRADLLLLLGALLVREGHEALLEGDGEGDERVAGVVLVDPGLDLGEPFVLLADVVPLGEVDEVGDWLGGEELEAVDDVDLEEGCSLVCHHSGRGWVAVQIKGFLIGMMGRYSRLGELG